MAKDLLVRAADGFDLPPLNMEEGTSFGWFDRWQVGQTPDGKLLTDYADWEARDMYEMLSKDYKARQMENVMVLPILSSERSIVAAKGDTGEAEWLQNYWDTDYFSGGCHTSLDQIVGLMTSAFAYRRAYFEKVWRKGTHDFTGKTVYDDVAFRPQTTCRILREPRNGRFAGFEQEAYYIGPEITRSKHWPIQIKPSRAFVFTHGTRRDPLNGTSDLEIAFWAWKTKQKVLLLWFQFLQGVSLPRIVVKAQNQTTANEVAKQIARMKSSGVLPVGVSGGPDSVDVSLLDASGKGADQFQAVIQWLDNAATQSILAGFLNLSDRGMPTDGKGSFALSKDASDFFLQSLESKAREIEEQVRSGLFAPLIRHNFGPNAVIPRLAFEPLNDIDKETAVALLTAAMAAPPGGPVPTDFIAGLAEQVSNYIGLDGTVMKESFKSSFDAAAAQAKAQALVQAPNTGGASPVGQHIAGIAGAVDAAHKASAAGLSAKNAFKNAKQAHAKDITVGKAQTAATQQTGALVAKHTDDSLRAKTGGAKHLGQPGAIEPVAPQRKKKKIATGDNSKADLSNFHPDEPRDPAGKWIKIKDGRVYHGNKSVGKVRPNNALEGTGKPGRAWVGLDRNGKRVTGLHETQQGAAAAVIAAWLG